MNQRYRVLPSFFLAASVTLAGCSSGGSSGSSPAPAPAPPPPPPAGNAAITVVPASYDFGRITTGNTPAPLQVTISNTGTAALTVTGVTLSSPTSGPYSLAVGGGAKPCNSATPTIAASDACTMQVLFSPTTDGTFNASLQITSNATNSPAVSLAMVGIREAIQTLTVRINQIECTSTNATAYVSVIDQGGFSVLGLGPTQFTFTENALGPKAPATAVYIEDEYAKVAIASLLDYSKSLRDQPVAFADMKNGFSSLVKGLAPGDEGEILKFATEFQVVQPFTSVMADLQTAITAPFNQGDGTRLYDTIYKAIDDTSAKTTFRRAVIVATDGKEDLPAPPATTPATYKLADVIKHANDSNLPVFAIGLGASLNSADLKSLAEGTGGLYYQADTSANLATIYSQLATLLYSQQYKLTFTVTGTTGSIKIGATAPPAVSGEGTRDFTCN
jgi:hypothetical protein